MWAERSQPGRSFVTSTVNINMSTSATWGHSSLSSELTIIVTSFLQTQKAPKRWQSWTKVPSWKILEVPGDLQSHDYQSDHHQRHHDTIAIALIIALILFSMIMIIILMVRRLKQRPKKSELSGWQLPTRKNFPGGVRKSFSRQKKTRKSFSRQKNVRKFFLWQKRCINSFCNKKKCV